MDWKSPMMEVQRENREQNRKTRLDRKSSWLMAMESSEGGANEGSQSFGDLSLRNIRAIDCISEGQLAVDSG